MFGHFVIWIMFMFRHHYKVYSGFVLIYHDNGVALSSVDGVEIVYILQVSNKTQLIVPGPAVRNCFLLFPTLDK